MVPTPRNSILINKCSEETVGKQIMNKNAADMKATIAVADDADDYLDQKVVESQELGLKLAEEIRKLRAELLKEKQERRILIVKNTTLEEQIRKVEEKNERLVLLVRGMEDEMQKISHKLEQEVRILS
jgi:hypothetical protein